MAEVKKPVAVAPASAEKKAEAVAAAKPAVKKATAVKKAAAKPAVKKAAAKPAAKKAAAKPAVKKAAAKPAAAKKPAAKKATKKVVVKSTIELQFDDRNVDVDKLVSRAAKDYKKINKADAKKIDIYVNAAEKMVYYVADGVNGSFEA
ncbi:MAG: DUF6465 family protein [Lachnospiraceae bacterium]|nr:DUF6465 family protein [Lachnospiraceae bacterium]